MNLATSVFFPDLYDDIDPADICSLRCGRKATDTERVTGNVDQLTSIDVKKVMMV